MTPTMVSIVTPSFNQGRFVEETIKSVISQEGDFHIEYLIMDGGSTDDSVEVIKKYGRLLKEGKWPVRCRGIEYKWVSEKDKGQADAVNKGFRAAKGETLGWLNSDDTYLPGAIEKAVRFFNEHSDVMMVYGEGYHIKESGEVIQRYYTEPFDKKRLSEVCFICQPAVFLRRRVIDEAGLLDAGLHYCMDYEYWMRIAKRFKIGYLPEYLANSRLHPETKTMSRRFDVHKEIVKAVKLHYGYVPDSWVHAYTRVFLERWLSLDKGLKKALFKIVWPLLFVFKYIQINKAFPKLPKADMKSLLRK